MIFINLILFWIRYKNDFFSQKRIFKHLFSWDKILFRWFKVQTKWIGPLFYKLLMKEINFQAFEAICHTTKKKSSIIYSHTICLLHEVVFP